MSISKLCAKDHRANARAALGGGIFKSNWIMGLVISLVYSLLMGLAASFIPAVGSLIIAGPMAFGLAAAYLAYVRNQQADIEALFSGFKTDFVQTLLIGIMTAVFTFLWGLLFVIPGIVKSYAYSMAYYVKIDNPDWNWEQCITESRKLMDGNKWNLFCLDLSFIGWAIVCCFTFGIGALWLNPYMQAARASFYESIKEAAQVTEPAQEATEA